MAAYAVVLTAIAVLLAPAALPVLSPAKYAQVYGKAGNGGVTQESGDSFSVPQALADRFGREQQAALIAQVYHNNLTPAEQRVACVYTQNYGEAGARVQFNCRYHLPQ